MRIIFVRHGEPNYEKDCLTKNGRKHAKLVAKRLKDEGIDELWASPLGRAQETAAAISKKLGLPVKTLDFMREIEWGSTDGNPIFSDGHPWNVVDEMAHRGMDLTANDWRTNEFFINNKVVENVDRIEKGIDQWLCNYGYERKGFNYNHTSEENEHRTVAIVSHGGSSCAAMGHILNFQFPYMCEVLHIDFTGITIIRMDKNKGLGTLPCLELANDARHIK